MKIKDLTRGKYPVFTRYSKTNNEVSQELIDAYFISSDLENFLAEHQLCKEDAIQLLDRVPVFLVESSMAEEYVAIPGDECSIRVPADKGIGNVIDFDVDEWLEQMEDEEYGERKKPREWECKGHITSDLLGVYVFAGNDSVMPCRIFIWADKIARYVRDNTKNSNDVEERTRVLYELVLRHEMMHALMDVAAYGIAPCPYFNYSNPIYCYIEEALANYMALVACRSKFEGPHVNVGIKLFITSFVERQGGGYAVGLDLSTSCVNCKAKSPLLSLEWQRKNDCLTLLLCGCALNPSSTITLPASWQRCGKNVLPQRKHTMIEPSQPRNWRLNEPMLFCHSPKRNRSLKNMAEIVN